MIFQNEETPFQALKTRSSKRRKIDIFPKGLTHGFVPKMAIFLTVFLKKIQARKMSFTIFQNEKTFLYRQKKKKINKSKNLHFSKGVNLWFWSKNGHFFKVFFQSRLVRKMSYDILERKNSFLAYKNNKFKKTKTDISLKGLTHGFGTKMAIFSTFLFRQYSLGKCLLRYSRTKKHFSRI